jgi:hypothetical protein
MYSNFARRLTVGAVSAAALTSFGVGPLASADPLPYGPDTCAQGYVWREAIPSDHVCVTPDVRTRTQQENAAAAGLRDPNGAYGSNSCKQGYVWRNAFNGDAVCVTPNIRDDVAAENAAASSHLAPKQPAPQQPGQQQPAQPSEMIWEATGHGDVYTIVVDDGKTTQTMNAPKLPFTRTEVMTASPGHVYQIVVTGKGDAQAGCEISYQGKVVASQPVANSSAHCVWNAP